MSTPQKLPPEESLPLVAEIWTCQGEIDACRDDGMLGAFDTDHTQGNAHFDIGYVRLETATARESALIAERDALRTVGAKLANMAFNLAQYPGEPITQNIANQFDQCRREWDAIPRALSAPSVEGV